MHLGGNSANQTQTSLNRKSKQKREYFLTKYAPIKWDIYAYFASKLNGRIECELTTEQSGRVCGSIVSCTALADHDSTWSFTRLYSSSRNLGDCHKLQFSTISPRNLDTLERHSKVQKIDSAGLSADFNWHTLSPACSLSTEVRLLICSCSVERCICPF